MFWAYSCVGLMVFRGLLFGNCFAWIWIMVGLGVFVLGLVGDACGCVFAAGGWFGGRVVVGGLVD